MNKLFIIILSMVLSLPIVWAVDETATNINLEENVPVVNQLDEDLKYESVQPNNTKKIVKKFLAAMGGVAISSFTIFAMLSVYNKIRDRHLKTVNNISNESSLETPDNFDNAIKTFLDKTNWS